MSEPQRIECDVAVIGGGIAGMVTSTRLAQAGRRAVVFERLTDDRYVCNSRITTGVFHCALTDIMSPEDTLVDIITKATDGHANPALARAVAKDAKRAVRWLQSVGIRFIKGSAESYHNFVLSPPANNALGREWQGRGGDVLLRTLEAELKKGGGEVRRGHAADRLRKDGDRVVGFEGRTADGTRFEVHAKEAVVLCDGGFQGNFDRIRGPITPAPERVKQRNTSTGVGDGLRMAEEIGAALSDLRGFYGHVLSRDAMTNDILWPYPWVDELTRHSMIVGGDGRRFTDEGQGAIFVTNEIARLPDPLSTTVIFDDEAWNGLAAARFLPTNPTLPKAGGTVLQAPTLAEVARKAGLPEAAVTDEVAKYNAALAAGTLGQLSPARSTAKFKAVPIAKAPFYAIPVCAGLTYTMGGVLIDEHARVLDKGGRPIAGLYAAGSTTGGLEGGPRFGYVGGLVKASVTGTRAAEHIAGLPHG